MDVLSEYVCKYLFSKVSDTTLTCKQVLGNKLDLDTISVINDKVVCKVDQEVKHRKNMGLIKIATSIDEVHDWISQIPYRRFIVEPFMDIELEYYVMFEFKEDGDWVYFSKNGGVDFEDMTLCSKYKVEDGSIPFSSLGVDDDGLQTVINNLYKMFVRYGLKFMEVNPLVKTEGNSWIPLDFATRYDTTSLYKWGNEELGVLNKSKIEGHTNEAEQYIEDMDSKTGGSLKFTLLNKSGSIWTLVAGGGASVVYTDAIINCGMKDELGNYGEYSGNPPRSLVYSYAKKVFEVALNSSTNKDLKFIVGGGISNFTDVKVTFAGIIDAIKDKAEDLKKRGTYFYVRRGGLNYKEGLNNFKNICNQYSISCDIHGPEQHITKFVRDIFGCEQDVFVQKEENFEVIHQVDQISDLLPRFYNENSRSIIINYMPTVAQRIADFDYVSGKDTVSVSGIVFPPKAGSFVQIFFGSKEIFIPIFKSVDDGVKYDPKIDVVINYHSFRSAYESTKDALLNSKINCVATIAEGISERDARELRHLAVTQNKTLLGPSTVGSIMAGNLRVGNTCGSIDNIVSLGLFQKGSVSVVTRSGGLLNEMCNTVSKTTDGIKEAVSIGGDRYPGSSFLQHILRYEQDPDVKLICLLGEVGGIQELQVAEAVKTGLIKKPVVGWVTGTSAEHFTNDIQFGHAGSMATNPYETASYKNEYMRRCGVVVPNSFEEIDSTLKHLALQFDLVKVNKQPANDLPYDYKDLVKRDMIRKNSDFVSSISNETLDILEFNGTPVTEIVTSDGAIGKTLGHLLFKKDLPTYLAKFLEMVVVLCADHGIAVSSAHNTAVCCRAGQNLSASVASGLLCIHEKHGGAMQNAAKEFYNSRYVIKEEPQTFINRMKSANRYIPGIGHMYKNATTRIDKRIVLLLGYIKQEFPDYELVNYAKAVEEITLRKKENLILNVDGLVATAVIAAFIYEYGHQETEDLLELQSLNSLFIISRTIGLCATYADQRRLKQGLYRHPLDSINYLD